MIGERCKLPLSDVEDVLEAMECMVVVVGIPSQSSIVILVFTTQFYMLSTLDPLLRFLHGIRNRNV